MLSTSSSLYNAFCNSLQRFDFKGTLGPEGMLASDWLLPCVKFCAKPPSVFEEVGLSLFLAQKTDIFEICCEILWILKFPPPKSKQKWGTPQKTSKMSVFLARKSDKPTSFKLKWGFAQNLTQDNSQSEASIPSGPRVPLKSNLWRELQKAL